MHAYVCHATYLHIFPLYSKSIICKSEQARNRSVCMYIMLSVICLFTVFCTAAFFDITSQSPQFSHKKSIPTRICWEDLIIFDQSQNPSKKQEMHTLLKKHKRKDSIKKLASENLDAAKCILQVEIVTSEPWIMLKTYFHLPQKKDRT